MRKRYLALLAATGLMLSMTGIADAHHPDDGVNEAQNYKRHSIHDGVVDTPVEEHRAHDHEQHGSTSGHIAPTQQNMNLVGLWDAPRTKNQPGRITDVWSLGNYAYLGTFAPPCAGLGVNIVDMSDPASPEKANWIPSRPGTRVNDVKVFSFDGLASGFSGDLLLHSNENCNTNPERVGGISLWDVSDPLNPVRLAEGVGDTTATNADDEVVTLPRARQVHNIYAWQDGDNAYAAIVDDEELLDVDILDITDPSNPVHIGETGLPDWPTVNVDAYGGDAFVHDLWAMERASGWELLLSYWDAGFIRLNVSDPANPALVAESDYPDPDPLVLAATGLSLEPEGNAHAAVWDASGDLILAGDEDFSPYRLDPITVTEQTTGGGGVAGQPPVGTEYGAGEFGWTVPIAKIADGTLNGPVAFGGYACDESPAPPDSSLLDPFIDKTAASPEERILVVQRGPVNDPTATYPACFFSTKIHNGQDAGYDAVIIANHHGGAAGGSAPDAFVCGSQGHSFTVTSHGLCSGHRSMHELFGTTPSYETDYSGEDAPGMGDVGPKIETSSFFDGWGPFHLLNNTTMQEIDTWAPSEVHDEAFAQDFGDLTMHNVEHFGPGKAVISWYSLGARVLDFSGCGTTADPGCIQEVGSFVDTGGNNFWGVHVAWDHPTDPGLILQSDRDRGLYILEYSGP